MPITEAPGIFRKRNRVTKVLLACGLVAPPLFLLVIAIQAVFRDGFDIGRHVISLLTLGDLGWIQVVNFIASGILVIGFATGAHRVIGSGRGRLWCPLAIGGFGLGLVIAGIFIPDPSMGFPPGAPEGVPAGMSLAAMIHGVGFILSFGSIGIACIVCALRDISRGSPVWALYSIATVIAAFGLVIWPGQEGISIRYLAAAAIAWVWVFLLATRLLGHLSGMEPNPT